MVEGPCAQGLVVSILSQIGLEAILGGYRGFGMGVGKQGSKRREKTCPLCEAEHLTEWHYEGRVCWIANCLTCGTPMLVLKRHGVYATQWEEQHMLGVVREIFPGCTVRTKPRKIHDHVHWHVMGVVEGEHHVNEARP